MKKLIIIMSIMLMTMAPAQAGALGKISLKSQEIAQELEMVEFSKKEKKLLEKVNWNDKSTKEFIQFFKIASFLLFITDELLEEKITPEEYQTLVLKQMSDFYNKENLNIEENFERVPEGSK